MTTHRIERAIMLAAQLHAGTVDKGGKPYIYHPLRVMFAMDREDDQIAAVLHDTVEDCAIGLDEIEATFGTPVAQAVDALTRRPGETYADFIQRCGRNEIACRVKLADLADNMDLTRLGRALTDEDRARLRKYQAARDVLRDLAPA